MKSRMRPKGMGRGGGAKGLCKTFANTGRCSKYNRSIDSLDLRGIGDDEISQRRFVMAAPDLRHARKQGRRVRVAKRVARRKRYGQEDGDDDDGVGLKSWGE
jgi:hypothetical protein